MIILSLSLIKMVHHVIVEEEVYAAIDEFRTALIPIGIKLGIGLPTPNEEIAVIGSFLIKGYLEQGILVQDQGLLDLIEQQVDVYNMATMKNVTPIKKKLQYTPISIPLTHSRKHNNTRLY